MKVRVSGYSWWIHHIELVALPTEDVTNSCVGFGKQYYKADQGLHNFPYSKLGTTIPW